MRDVIFLQLIDTHVVDTLFYQIGRSEYVYIQVQTPSNCSNVLDAAVSASSNAILPAIKIVNISSLFSIQNFMSTLYWTVYLIFVFALGCFFLESVYRIVETCDRLQQVNMAGTEWNEGCFQAKKIIHILGVEIPVPEEMAKLIRAMRGWIVDHVYQSGVTLLPQSFINTLDAIAIATLKNSDNPTGELKSPLKRPFFPPRVEKQASLNSLSSIGMSSARSATTHSSGVTSKRDGVVDDLKRCYNCKKKLSHLVRPKHYCGSCHRNFCKSCAGHIAHVWPTPCKINSKCFCQACCQK